MAISLDLLEQANKIRPPRALVYGTHGIGKSTLAAKAPSPVFIRTEDGLDGIDAQAFPVAKSYDDVMEAIKTLATEDHDFQTLAIDSLDWLEPLVWKKTCEDHGWASIEAPGYGRGYVEALTHWREFLDAINYIRNEKNMCVMMIAHTTIKRFDAPDTEGYDRYEIKLHKGASALIQEHADMVLFANYQTMTSKEEKGFNAKRTRAVGTGERLLHCQERPALLAKNRYGMPESIPLDWNEVAKYIPFYNQQQMEITANG